MSDQDDSTNTTTSSEDDGGGEERAGCTAYHSDAGGACSGKCKFYKHAGSHYCSSCGGSWG